MDDLNALWQKVLIGQKKGVRPGSINLWLARETGGKITDVDSLKAALSGQDTAPSAGEATARGAVQGITLGHQDELAGAASMLPAFLGGNDEGYAANRDRERAANDAAKKAHRYLYGGAEIAGGLVPGALAVAAAPAAASVAPGIMGDVLVGSQVGMGLGAVAGEGNSKNTGLDLIDDISTGAAFGGVAGAVAPVILRPALGLIGAALARLKSPADQALARLAKIAPVKVAQDIASLAADTKAPVALVDANPQLADELRRIANTNPEVRAAAKEFMAARQSGQSERIASSMEENAGAPPGGFNVPEAVQAEKDALPALRKELYGPLEERYDQVVHPQVDAALQQPEIKDAYRMVKPDSREVASWNNSNPVDPQTGERPPLPPSFRRLQETYKDLKASAEKAWGKGDGVDGPKFSDAAKTLESAMEEAMSGFKAANRGYYTKMSTIRGYDDGGTAFGKSADQLSFLMDRAQKSGGPAAASAFRMGWFDKWVTSLRSPLTNANVAAKIAQAGPEVQQAFRIMFRDPEDLARFLRTAKAEDILMRANRALLGNSSTAQQVGDMLSAQGGGLPTGGPINWLKQGLSQAAQGTTKAGDAAAGNMLLQHGDPLTRTLGLIEQLKASQAARAKAGNIVTRGAAPGGVASLMGDYANGY